MEEIAIDMPRNGRQMARVARSRTFPQMARMARSKTFLQTDHPQRTSTGQDASLEKPSSPEDETNGRTANDEYRAPCSFLVQAAIKGDWPAAKAFLVNKPHYVRERITRENETALHIAAAAQHTTFIEGLLSSELGMTPEDVALQSICGFTTLHSAAQSGNVRIAKQLVIKNNNLPLILDNNNDTPLTVAAYNGRTNMVSYLLSVTPLEKLTVEKCNDLFHDTIYNDMYDMALKILEGVPIIVAVDAKFWGIALEVLATKPFAISSESQLSFWESLLKYSWFKRFKGIYNKALAKTLAHQLVERLWKMVGILDKQFSSKLAHYGMVTLILDAAKIGNVEFLILLAHSYPDLLWHIDVNNMSIFHYAIKYRHEHVFNLIYEIGAKKDTLASFVILGTKNNMLHLAGELAPLDQLNIVSGAALQMQRELLWFKEIERIVPRSYVNRKNSENKTPKEIFIKTHEELMKDGEKWMKDTANYCMLVATLIATVIFAAVFTVPGGNSQETGIPIFLRTKWLKIFFISDAIALCSSSSSIVIFLSILTSRYTKDDFLKLLPSKLLFGLTTLFIAMAGMMVAFIATLHLLYTSAKAWTMVVVITLASFPIILLVLLHCKLWVDIFRSTYVSRFLFRPNKHRLFKQKVLTGE